MQLSFDFDPPAPVRMPHPFRRDSYVVNVGGWRNCVVYGADSFPPVDGVFSEAGLLCFDFPVGNYLLDHLRSEAWSANCSHFMLFQESGAFLFPVDGSEVFCCPSRSVGFIEACLDGIRAAESLNFGKKAKRGKDSPSSPAF